MKTCNRCHETKSYVEFNADKTTLDGYDDKCQKCNSAQGKADYQKNREKRLAAVKERQAKFGRAAQSSTTTRRPRLSSPVTPVAETYEYIALKLSTAEWEGCVAKAEKLGITGLEYIRMIVQDALDDRGIKEAAKERQKKIMDDFQLRMDQYAKVRQERQAELDRRMNTFEAAALLHIGHLAIRKLIKDGKLPARIYNGNYYLYKEDLQAYLDQNKPK